MDTDLGNLRPKLTLVAVTVSEDRKYGVGTLWLKKCLQTARDKNKNTSLSYVA
jgi:hypothetical protein